MNDDSLLLASNLIGSNYVSQSNQSRKTFERAIQTLLSQRKLPKKGWSNSMIISFLHHLSNMDSNNFNECVGVGEREGRIYSELVACRHYYFSHGIGRSGDINAVQPKAAGSSLLNKILNFLTVDILKLSGLKNIKSCIVLPFATGMSISFTLLSLKTTKPNSKYVIWPRIDQKTCLKSIFTAGLTPIVVEGHIIGDEIVTDIPTLTSIIKSLDNNDICCILSTTSCFSPRTPDNVVEIAKICKEYNIPHIINNAYGLQSLKICENISKAGFNGRVDYIIQSTDKNLMVPVGGAIIASYNKQNIEFISNLYPGRANMGPILDLFITMLKMGSDGYLSLLESRQQLYNYFIEKLNILTTSYDERILVSKNPISIAISIKNFGITKENNTNYSYLGSMLFSRMVSGTRVFSPGNSKKINNISFENYGCSSNNYNIPYLNVACAIGITKSDVDNFVKKIESCFIDFKKQKNK